MFRRAMLRSTLAALVLVSVTACEHAPFSPLFDRGTYALVSANGGYVPSTVYHATTAGRFDHIDVTGGSLTLRTDGSYRMLVVTHEDVGGVVADVTHAFAGSYDSEGSILYLTYDLPGAYGGGQMQATWLGGDVEVVVPDVAMGNGVLLRFGY
jgi:hypothetical protein